MYEDARQLLRQARKHADLTQAELACQVSSSLAAIRSYESLNAARQRNPNREHLEKILNALYASREEATAVMEGFGYSTTRTLYPTDKYPDYFFDVDELQTYVDRVAWPEFVVNSAVDIVAANKAAESLWGVTLADERGRTQSGAANLLAVASQSRVTDRIVNWEECVSIVVGTLKGQPERPEQLDEPSRRFENVLEDFAGGEPSSVARLLDLWARTTPLQPKVRWDYPVVWRDPEVGEMRFHAIVSTASEPGGLAFNDWHPADVESWERFGLLRQGGDA